MELAEIFYYDPESPSGLRWVQDRRSGRDNRRLSRKSGDVAGSLRKDGYWRVSVGDKVFLAHRVVWGICKGQIPEGMVIDHIDRNNSNNKIENLRLVTIKVNSRNASMYSTNTTGVTGVNYQTPEHRSPRYVATWYEDGKLRQKPFSTKKYGEELAFQLAINFRKDMIEKLNQQGAEYTENHGERK